MRNVILLLMTIGLSACGKQYQDPAVADIVNQFVQDASAHGKNLQVNNEIEFGAVGTSDQGTVIGECVYDNVDNLLNGKIVLYKAWWYNASDTNRKMVLYHELGHCALHRDHRNDMETISGSYPAPTINFSNQPVVIDVPITFTTPVSIMHLTVPTDLELQEGGSDYYNSLLEELFK